MTGRQACSAHMQANPCNAPMSAADNRQASMRPLLHDVRPCSAVPHACAPVSRMREVSCASVAVRPPGAASAATSASAPAAPPGRAPAERGSLVGGGLTTCLRPKSRFWLSVRLGRSAHSAPSACAGRRSSGSALVDCHRAQHRCQHRCRCLPCNAQLHTMLLM